MPILARSLPLRLGSLLLALTLLLAFAPAARAQEGGVWYEVQKGDTLYNLARRYNVSVAIIASANGITNPDRIIAGQKLWIPTGDAPPPAESGLWHTVLQGENLYRIASRYGLTVAQLAAANHITSYDRIQAGQRLWVPGTTTKPAPSGVPAGTRWVGLFFNNKTLSGSPVLTESTEVIDFTWGDAAPPRLPLDGFSAIWTGNFRFEPGAYRFLLTVDDGARLYIDDVPVINAWRDQSLTGYFVDVNLSGGEHLLRVEYYDNAGWASISLSWRLY
ncbi:MAG: LysM peptidoglycan-binding domain-containing protein [Caldilineales bacterium]|nr:LysM peptidoglycan-binding domain-containing protein [Caldilineales bacterium]